MVWEGRRCSSSSQRKQALFPSTGEQMFPRRGTNYPYLESSTSLLGEIPTKARGEPAITAETRPSYRRPVRTKYKRVFRPVVVRARTSSGHDAKHYWLLLRTTTGSLADQYWSDFPPHTALDLNSADFTLTEQIKGLGLPPCGGRPRHVRRERE